MAAAGAIPSAIAVEAAKHFLHNIVEVKAPSGVILRASPDESGEKVGAMPKGALLVAVEILASKRGAHRWAEVLTAGPDGEIGSAFVAAEFLGGPSDEGVREAALAFAERSDPSELAMSLDRAEVIGYLKGLALAGVVALVRARGHPGAAAAIAACAAISEAASALSTAMASSARKIIQSNLHDGNSFDTAVWFYFEVHQDTKLW